MEVTSALLVDQVVKHPDGRVDLLGLFEDVYVESVPVTLESLTLFLDLEIAPNDKGRPHRLELRLVDAAGTLVQPALRVGFDLPSADEYPRSTAQLDLDFADATFRCFGDHVIEVALDGETKRRVHLSLQPREQ